MATTMAVELDRSAHGTPEPTLRLRFEKGLTWRGINAATLRVAADVEEQTASRERWVVNHSTGTDCATIWLELFTGSTSEAERGLAVLRGVMARGSR